MLRGFALLALVALPMSGFAVPVTIVGYDVLNTPTSGFGQWQHTYTGVITPTNQVFANYSGGTGTMANGVIETTHQTTHLFIVDSAPVITLYLDGFYSLNSLSIFGGDIPYNGAPGALKSLTATFSGTSSSLVGSAFGFVGLRGPANDLFTFAGTSLQGLVTDRVVLSGFQTSGLAFASIAEITLDGSATSVPEPGTLALFGLGLVGLGFARRRRATN